MTHCLCQQHFLNHLNFKWENEMFTTRLVVRTNRYLLSSLYSNIGSFREKKNVKRETIFPSPTLFWSIARQASLHHQHQIFRHLKQISDSHTPFIRCQGEQLESAGKLWPVFLFCTLSTHYRKHGNIVIVKQPKKMLIHDWTETWEYL